MEKFGKSVSKHECLSPTALYDHLVSIDSNHCQNDLIKAVKV